MAEKAVPGGDAGARWLKDFFFFLHAHPELGFQEHRPTDRLRKALEAHGIECLKTGMETGLIARITGKRPGRVIGLRCDIDALPVQEESGLAYASQTPGVMHACGHDSHAAVMLGAALKLKEREAELAGTVKVIFQPAEEVDGGAKMMIKTGLLADVDEFYSVHSYPWFEPGTLGIKEGPVMAAVDQFLITLKGRGSHAGYPYRGIDPIPAAAALTLSAQTIVSRRLDAFSPAVVSITRVTAGNTWNVIPETAELEGTVRTLNPEDRELIREELSRMAENIAAAHRCTAEFQWMSGSPAVINDSGLCEAARELALEMGFDVQKQENAMGAEDFSEYLAQKPGVFIRVGTGGRVSAHHPKFTVDPEAIAPAAAFFARLAEVRAAIQRDKNQQKEDDRYAFV